MGRPARSSTSTGPSTSGGSHRTVPEINKEAAKRTTTSLLTTSESKLPRTWNTNDPYSLWTDSAPPTPGVSSPTPPSTITEIRNLVCGSRDIQIEGRVSLITSLREFENAKGPGNVFDVTVVDGSGETILTLWNKPELHGVLTINCCVSLKNCIVKPCTSQFLNFPASLTLGPNGTIEVVNKELEQIPFSMVSIEEVLEAQDGVKADMLAVCFKVEPVRHVPATNPRHTVSDVFLTDKTKKVVKLTLWNQDASDFDPKDYTVLALRKVEVTSYDGKNL